MSKFIEPRLDRVPESLTSRNQWVVWKAVEKPKKPGQFTKIPYDPKTGRQAATTRPTTWGSFDEAVEAYSMSSEYTGIGFVFSPNDPFIGIDLDHCFDENGAISKDALASINMLDSYTERSPSGKGLHIICEGRLPGTGHNDMLNGREMYHRDRFFTITADIVQGKGQVQDRSEKVVDLYETWFGSKSLHDFRADKLSWDDSAVITSLEKLHVSEETKNLIRNGEGMDAFRVVDGKYDRSMALFFVCRELVVAGANKETVLTILTDKDNYLAQPALERRGGVASAREWLWSYTVAKVMKQHEDEKALFDDYNEVEQDREGLETTEKDHDDSTDSDKKPQQEIPFVKGNFEKNALLFLKHSVPLVRHQEQFFQYNTKCWQLYSDEQVERDIQRAVYGRGFSMAQINNTIKTVRRFSVKDNFAPAPTVVAFQNGVVDLAGWDIGLMDTTLMEHSRDHKCMGLVDFDYDSTDGCSRWVSFLEEVFEGDQERIMLLQEWIGYLLVYDYRFQKILVMSGLSRTGKGTILKVIESLLGGSDICKATTLSALSKEFGAESLLTAKAAVIPDAKQSQKSGINQAHEMILSISGNDAIYVNRKNKSALTVRVPARLMIVANSVPRFMDDSDALFNRYMILDFRVSFAGREDVTLIDKLQSELPGIFNWALAGLTRLGQQGKFTETQLGVESSKELRVFNNPVASFVEKFLKPGGHEDTAPVQHVYDLFRQFCEAVSTHPMSKIDFARKLNSIAPWLIRDRSVHNGKDDRVRIYRNVIVDNEVMGDYIDLEF